MHRRKKPKISSSDFWATSTDLPVNLQIPRNYCFWKTSCTSWYGSLSHCLQGFIHVGWCRISSNNNSSHSQSSSKVQWLKSRWHSPYILVYNYHQLPLTYFLVSVSSILNLRYVFFAPKGNTLPETNSKSPWKLMVGRRSAFPFGSFQVLS